MVVIELLPEVDMCCFFIPLKWGTVIIVFIALVLCFGVWMPTIFYSCSSEKNAIQQFTHQFSFVLMFANVVLAFVCILFLFLIIVEKVAVNGSDDLLLTTGTAAKMFIYVGLVFFVIYIAFIVLSLLGIMTNHKCPFPMSDVIMAFITVFCWVYFFIVVKSYAFSESEEEYDE